MNDEIEKKENPEKEDSAEVEGKSESNNNNAKSEVDLEIYPLREPSDDPRWAIRVVKIWIGFVIAALIFILTLLVLGAIYD
ncbi:hypothetical protein ACFL1Z_05300 [Thermodesulfobacteriota bacterium]